MGDRLFSKFTANVSIRDFEIFASCTFRPLVRLALNELDDKRIKQIKPLIPPQILMEDLPLTLQAAQSVISGRTGAEAILKGLDDRLLVIIGPCSVHDVRAALEYGLPCVLWSFNFVLVINIEEDRKNKSTGKLKAYKDEAKEDLCIIMRVYFEKPRTTVGWKGLINDPHLNNRCAINQLGIPCGCEFLDTITPQYIADLVAWGAIGARTTESQVHRELASGLSVPVGFKNGTDGNISIAIDAIKAAGVSHHFLSVTKQGLSAIVATESDLVLIILIDDLKGNDCCHVILRGGAHGPNYSADHVKSVAEKLEAAKLAPRVMIDCSHGNSQKVFSRQVDVAKDIADQLSSSPTGNNIFGVMIESHLKEGLRYSFLVKKGPELFRIFIFLISHAGRQDLTVEGPSSLIYGQSITDPCISWETTVEVLDILRKGVRARRVSREKTGLHPNLAFNE
ncbi:hypothetical protein G9A89_013309 [Geosiphon pyriformis]|nr:hypothetical protein G9A89_013309 [Geosiphon pyriformis]